MRQLLLINPNTSEGVTALLHRHVQHAVERQAVVHSVTARFGAAYIASEASYAVAAHATLDAWAAWLATAAAPPDAVLVGCFGDPGLFALRESSSAPVTGLAEAAFAEAAAFGRFAIVTGGERWKPMLQRLAHALGHGDALAGIHTVQPSGAELAADPGHALALLRQACRDAVQQWKVQSVILGGAGLAGMAAQIQDAVGVPVIDSVLAGARQALLASVAAPAAGLPASNGFEARWQGLSAEMQAFSQQA